MFVATLPEEMVRPRVDASPGLPLEQLCSCHCGASGSEGQSEVLV